MDVVGLDRSRDWRLPVAVALAAVACLVVEMRVTGRLWRCRCGSWIPWTAGAHTEHTSQHLVDAYSFSHVIHGMIFYAALRWLAPRWTSRWRWAIAVVVEVAWEAIENSPVIIDRYRNATAALGYSGDSILNSLGDVGCAMLGFWLARRMAWPATLALAIVFELGCLFWIRDNLTLNVIMLVCPTDAIRQWPSGAA